MLVLSRKNHEAVVIGGSESIEHMIKITVVEIKNGRVRLGFEATRMFLSIAWRCGNGSVAIQDWPICDAELVA